jgi:hypothetical protein
MKVRFLSGAVVDAATVAKAGDELDIAIPLARAFVSQGIAQSLEPIASPIRSFYVDGTNGSDSNDGLSIVTPLATIGAAIAAAVSGRGDVIFVMPGIYSEHLVVNKNDISILSACHMGAGVTTDFRPVIEGGLGVALTIAQCYRLRMKGFYLHSSGAAAVLTDGEGPTFENCEIDADGGAGVKFLSATDPAFTGSGTSFLNCIFDGSVNGIKVFTSTAPGSTGQATNCVVDSCQFYGNSGADIADDGANDGNYFDSWLITGCAFQDKAKAVYLAMKGAGAAVSSKVMICGNFFGATAAADATMFALPAGAMFAGNYTTKGVVDGSAF